MPGSMRSRTTKVEAVLRGRGRGAAGPVPGPVDRARPGGQVTRDDLGDRGVVVDDEDAEPGPRLRRRTLFRTTAAVPCVKRRTGRSARPPAASDVLVS